MKTKHLSQDQVLMDAFNFNLRDLHANREGRITKAQRTKLLRRETQTTLPILALMVVLVFISILLLIIDWINNYRSFGLSGLIGISLLGFSAIILFFGISNFFILKNRLHSSYLESIQGIIIVDITAQAASVKIGDLQLHATRNALLTLKHMEPYVIHYLPKSKVIVSVEVMQS